MKRTELAKHKGKTIESRAGKTDPDGRFGRQSNLPDRREQRRLDQARGLVPLAVKVDGGLVNRLQALALERGTGLNEVVAELLTLGLESK